MKFSEYQKKAAETDRTGVDPERASLVSVLGLSGEAGTLAASLKKFLREGPNYKFYREHVAEELGDILWYVATLASKQRLSLDQVAHRNLRKIRSRWSPEAAGERVFRFLDEGYPKKEQLPRRFKVLFRERRTRTGAKLFLSRNGRGCGDPLTDNSYFEDGYRFHDVFHLAYAAVLGWSPVTRKLLGCKRRSSPRVDEVEDGGRATVIEEGISAFVFDYAKAHNFLDGITEIDFDLLKLVKSLTSNLEVRRASWRDWELAILEGYRIFRIINRVRGGYVVADLFDRKLEFERFH